MDTSTQRIKIYTRSMNGVLYRKAMSLCRLPYPKVRLQGTTADGYLYQLIDDRDADWVINIDEDAFVCDLTALQRLIEYCIANGYTNCGMPDGGVVHLRDGNPLVTNPYFNILDTKTIRQQFSPSLLGEKPDPSRFTSQDMLIGSHDFNATDVEPYYPFFIWTANHCPTLYLKATNHPDGESTVLCNHLGEPFLIHTWYSRFYNRDCFHTRRIDRAFREACNSQGITYRSPLRDSLTSAYSRTRYQLTNQLVSLKHKIVHR